MSTMKIVTLLTITMMVSSTVDPHIEGAKGVHPIVDLKALTSGCLLGATVNGKWLKAAPAAPLIKGGEKYRIYTLTGYSGEGTGSKPSSAGTPCEETMQVSISPPPGEANSIAIGGEWNALPRVPKVMSTTDRVYREAVGDILKRNGISHPTVKITQILRVDLEGDGVDEVVISATNYATGSLSPNSQAGDYSLVLLRKVIKGRVETIALDEEYHPQAKTFNAPNEYMVSGILDTDGDATMEIIVHGRYYEGAWTTVYRVAGNKALEALTCGCGA